MSDKIMGIILIKIQMYLINAKVLITKYGKLQIKQIFHQFFNQYENLRKLPGKFRKPSTKINKKLNKQSQNYLIFSVITQEESKDPDRNLYFKIIYKQHFKLARGNKYSLSS